jgi:uncharacterized protein YneF (UPF0154 family)
MTVGHFLATLILPPAIFAAVLGGFWLARKGLAWAQA